MHIPNLYNQFHRRRRFKMLRGDLLRFSRDLGGPVYAFSNIPICISIYMIWLMWLLQAANSRLKSFRTKHLSFYYLIIKIAIEQINPSRPLPKIDYRCV